MDLPDKRLALIHSIIDKLVSNGYKTELAEEIARRWAKI